MKIRLGYVAITKALPLTSSSTISYTNYVKLENKGEKLDSVIKSNLNDLEKIIDYNIKNNIHFYRLTSKLIPLVTHPSVSFDYLSSYKDYYERIGNKIKISNMRVDVHPDQFTVLNSTNKDVIYNTFEILRYHYNILYAFNINPIIILHIGSSVLGKKNSISRFINNYDKLPLKQKKSIVLENDDKVYNVLDTLELCERLSIPMVLDYHHYVCNKGDIDINDYYKRIFNTWNSIRPKVHFSSPKNKTKKEIRSHNDYIDSDSFIKFIDEIKALNYDIDIMLEAKEKDDALFRLVRELKYKTTYQFIDETSFIVD